MEDAGNEEQGSGPKWDGTYGEAVKDSLKPTDPNKARGLVIDSTLTLPDPTGVLKRVNKVKGVPPDTGIPTIVVDQKSA